MLRFWFCRSHFGVFQGCVYKIWSLNPTRSIFEGIFWKRLSIKCLPCRISTLKRSCPLDKYFWLPNTFQEQALMWKLFRNNFEFKYYSGELPTVGIIRSKIRGRGVRINYSYSGVCWRGGYAKVAGIFFIPKTGKATSSGSSRVALRTELLEKDGQSYNVGPPKSLSWFITAITRLYGSYNYI